MNLFLPLLQQAQISNVLWGEPDFLNPNSYKNITKVLQRIGIRADIKHYGGESREWLFVECDGLPYTTMRDLITNVWHCILCQECFYKLPAFHDHKCFILHRVDPIHEFGWVIPISGLLHLEMNAARSFVKLNWDVFTSTLGYELGFISIKAQEYSRKGSDHHKTWHFLELLYLSLSMELVTPYINNLPSGTKSTGDGYWNWFENIIDPNYVYLQHMTFTYLYSLMMLRAGVRKCNATAVGDAKTKISCLFFGRNHPIYQNIVYLDTLDTVLMPPPLKDIKNKYISGSRTGNIGKSQGGDALLEEINKDSKSWLKMAGIPSERHWLWVFRNVDSLNKVSKVKFFFSLMLTKTTIFVNEENG